MMMVRLSSALKVLGDIRQEDLLSYIYYLAVAKPNQKCTDQGVQKYVSFS